MASANELYAQVVNQASSDPAFKKRLLADPSGILRNVGIEVPNGVTVKIVEDTDTVIHLILPAINADTLSEEDLKAVAGGMYATSAIGGCPDNKL